MPTDSNIARFSLEIRITETGERIKPCIQNLNCGECNDVTECDGKIDAWVQNIHGEYTTPKNAFTNVTYRCPLGQKFYNGTDTNGDPLLLAELNMVCGWDKNWTPIDTLLPCQGN